MTFRYPQELNPTDVDYVVFTPHKYVTNKGMKSGVPAPATGSPVMLYMPNSTPAVTNQNEFGEVRFNGKLGEITRDLATTASSEIDKIGDGGNAGDALKNIASTFGDNIADAPGAAKQLAVKGVAEAAGMQANQLLAMSRGLIYNPNIELLYKGPKLRGFNFQYTFVPKSAQEAAEVNKIIKHFKMHSSPFENDHGMYVVPDVFSVKYMHRGGPNRNMNEFKRAALQSISVQANPGLPMHMSFENGMPIITQIAMQFMEVDVITRNDHMNSVSNIGF